MRIKSLLVLAIFFFGFVPAAKADPIPMSPELKAFLMRPEQHDTVLGMMHKQWSVLVGNCDGVQLKQTNVSIARDPTFDDAGNPKSGLWRVIGRFEGCGQSRIFNIMYGFTPDGQMKRIGLLPGTTAADLTLQKDALTYAAMGMMKIAPKDCKDVQYTDTQFISFGEANPSAMPGRSNRSWTEEWTVRSCGVTGVVTMRFIPDATGTTITSSPDETRQISP